MNYVWRKIKAKFARALKVGDIVTVSPTYARVNHRRIASSGTVGEIIKDVDVDGEYFVDFRGYRTYVHKSHVLRSTPEEAATYYTKHIKYKASIDPGSACVRVELLEVTHTGNAFGVVGGEYHAYNCVLYHYEWASSGYNGERARTGEAKFNLYFDADEIPVFIVPLCKYEDFKNAVLHYNYAGRFTPAI